VRGRPQLPVAVLGSVIGVLALLARLLPMLRGRGIGGIPGYDDGVYFGAAENLVFGRLPYRDFAFLHPPGIIVVLSPFAELSRLTTDIRGFTAAQLAFICVGAANAVFVFLVARRNGPIAGVFAGTFYALWGPATFAERTTLLEPLVTLGLLVGLYCLGDLRTTSPRRALLGGVALGLAASVKIWGVVPLIALGLWLLVRAGPRRALLYLGGSVAAAVVVCGPFFVAAPGRMFRLVVLDQLGRTNNGMSTIRRLLSISDVHLATRPVTTSSVSLTLLVVASVALLSLWLAVADPRARPWVSLLILHTAVLALTPSYYPHYAAFVAPVLALVMGAAAGHLAGLLHEHAPRLRPVAAIAGVVVLAGVAGMSQRHVTGHRAPSPALRQALSQARCVTGDSTANLIGTNVLGRDLRRGCPVVVDITGLTYTLAGSDMAQGNTLVARRHNAVWQRFLTHYFLASDAVILQRGNAAQLNEHTLALVHGAGATMRAGHFEIFEPPRG
jgi:alpha-1,2-mannosyltransferase